jgi:uncharacterized protein YjbI with pentapeptide repeats
MAKLIKFDLIIDGNKVKTFEELQDNLHADLLPYLKSGKLAKWFLSRDLADKAAAIAAIDLNQSDLALLSAVCEVLELEADDDILQEILDTADKLAAAIPAVSTNDTDSNIEAETSESTTTGYREDWSGRDLSGRSFKGDDLSRYNFAGANLSECDFSEANLEGANFEGANLSSAKFVGSNLNSANFEGADLDDTNFDDTKLKDACLEGTSLKNASFDRSDLTRTSFSKATLVGASFRDARLIETNFTESVFEEDADFNGAAMVKTNFSFAIFEGNAGGSLKSAIDKVKSFKIPTGYFSDSAEDSAKVLLARKVLVRSMGGNCLEQFEGVKFTGVNWGED